MEIEDYLEKPYWVIDILPKQVPANSRGQYFEIEKYYLEQPQLDIIYKKFTDILLKLNCYENMDFSSDGENWNTNPLPQEIKAAMMQCMADKQMLYIDMKPIDVMIIVSGDDTNMTVYHPTTEILELLGSIVASEGLFLWKPDQETMKQ